MEDNNNLINNIRAQVPDRGVLSIVGCRVIIRYDRGVLSIGGCRVIIRYDRGVISIVGCRVIIRYDL
jgi:hypothetical protein